MLCWHGFRLFTSDRNFAAMAHGTGFTSPAGAQQPNFGLSPLRMSPRRVRSSRGLG